MEKNTQQSTAVKEMIAGLKSADQKVILKTIKAIRSNGNASLLPYLLVLLEKSEDQKVKGEILALLNDLHEEDAVEPMIEGLKNKKLASIRALILSSFWQSRLDASEYIIDIVKIAVNGNFLEAMEAQTVITNLEGPFEEEHLLESMLLVQKYLQEDPKDDKRALVLDIMEHLKALDVII